MDRSSNLSTVHGMEIAGRTDVVPLLKAPTVLQG
jgi:hypothetical protein